MLDPSIENEVQIYLSKCVGIAAKAKGFANSGLYDVAELLEFLRTQHPDTHVLLKRHIDAYAAWAELDRKAAAVNREQIFGSKVLIPGLERSQKERDAVREALLDHLGPLDA